MDYIYDKDIIASLFGRDVGCRVFSHTREFRVFAGDLAGEGFAHVVAAVMLMAFSGVYGHPHGGLVFRL
ncbi:hypothetical protein [Nocardia sp. NPDC057353]|uniref:hypothetical protein n=1 Tax=Nocardia sp. NPDC057353 TaxID=3346104 RepID=UPI003629D08E